MRTIILLSVLSLLFLVPSLAIAGGAIQSDQTLAEISPVPDKRIPGRCKARRETRILVTVTTMSGDLSPLITLYPPNSKIAESSANAYGGNTTTLDDKLAQTGTYSLVISDGSSTHTGTYHITLLDLSSPGSLNLGTLESGQTQSGNINAIPGMNVLTFQGTMGDRVLATVTTTTGSSFPI